MSKIEKIMAREILDSRGNPTIETKVVLENKIWAKAAVPSGASKGIHEALELRDEDKSRFLGRGVLRACQNVNEIIAKTLIGQEVSELAQIDKKMIELDGTENKSKLGANAILGVSLACARAASYDKGMPLYYFIRQTYGLPILTYELPTPMFNIINGGKHSDSGLNIQEFMIIPVGAKSFGEKVRIGVEIFNTLREILEKRRLTFSGGDEGGFAPKLKTTKNTLDLLTSVIQYTKYQLGSQIFYGLDAASSVFFNEEKKRYFFEGKMRTSEEMMKIYLEWIRKYPMKIFEDPFAEEDWSSWQRFTERVLSFRPDFLIVGDDCFTTNPRRLKIGIEIRANNAILIKPNQIGTLSETIDCIKLARSNNYKIIISHRSGETNDDFISDLAVAVGADFIKAGAPSRGERVAKYNRLMEIERELIY